MATLSGPRIRHTVVFTLGHDEGSAEAETFLASLWSLGAIDGVEELEVMRQVSPKNSYQLGVAMEFANRAAFDAYTSHPAHVAFVDNRWNAEVTDFMEIDFAATPTRWTG